MVISPFINISGRLWSGSTTQETFICPHTRPQDPLYTTHRNSWRNMRNSRSQPRYFCFQISVDSLIIKMSRNFVGSGFRPVRSYFTFCEINPGLCFSLSQANQRAGEAVDPARRWFLWKGPRPCGRDSEMGRLCGQALPWLFHPHGQVPFLPGESARFGHRLQ